MKNISGDDWMIFVEKKTICSINCCFRGCCSCRQRKWLYVYSDVSVWDFLMIELALEWCMFTRLVLNEKIIQLILCFFLVCCLFLFDDIITSRLIQFSYADSGWCHCYCFRCCCCWNNYVSFSFLLLFSFNFVLLVSYN